MVEEISDLFTNPLDKEQLRQVSPHSDLISLGDCFAYQLWHLIWGPYRQIQRCHLQRVPRRDPGVLRSLRNRERIALEEHQVWCEEVWSRWWSWSSYLKRLINRSTDKQTKASRSRAEHFLTYRTIEKEQIESNSERKQRSKQACRSRLRSLIFNEKV